MQVFIIENSRKEVLPAMRLARQITEILYVIRLPTKAFIPIPEKHASEGHLHAMSLEIGDLRAELKREKKIIGVEICDVLAVRARKAEIAGRAHSMILAIRMSKIANLRGHPRRGHPCYFGALVGRAIVDEEEFPVGVVLRENAIDRLLQERLLVQENDDDAHQRRVAHVGIPCHRVSVHRAVRLDRTICTPVTGAGEND